MFGYKLSYIVSILFLREFHTFRESLTILPCAVCGLQFTSPFNGNKVTGVLGSSVNFTWAFHGGNIDRVELGTKKDGSVAIKDVLISIDKLQTITTIQNPPYSGRVSGSGDASSGQVVFSLSQIKTSDNRLYGCRISPTDVSADTQKLDSVYLEVNGEYPFVIKTLRVARGGQNRTGCKLKCSLSCSTGSVAKKEVEGRQE